MKQIDSFDVQQPPQMQIPMQQVQVLNPGQIQMINPQPQQYIVANQQVVIGQAISPYMPNQIVIQNSRFCEHCRMNTLYVERTALHLIVFIVLILLFWPAALCMLCCCRSRIQVCSVCMNCDNRNMYFCIE